MLPFGPESFALIFAIQIIIQFNSSLIIIIIIIIIMLNRGLKVKTCRTIILPVVLYGCETGLLH